MPHKDKDEYNAYMRKYMLARYHTRRNLAIEKLGSRCIKCGISASLVPMHFHHTDPTNKEFTIGKQSSASEERFWLEIAKCVLVCEDCHIVEHSRPL